MKFEYLNKWLLYPWVKHRSNNEFVHPNDLDSIDGFRIVNSIGEDDDYLIVKTLKGETVRVRQEGILKILPTPQFKIGDWVKEIMRPDNQGRIYDFMWHDKDAEYKYFITVNGKKKSKRYNSSELR